MLSPREMYLRFPSSLVFGDNFSEFLQKQHCGFSEIVNQMWQEGGDLLMPPSLACVLSWSNISCNAVVSISL